MPNTVREAGGGRREAQRPRIAVAAGVLIRASGEVLIAQRPEGKIAAGQWEFPGGKIEPGESARDALVRELHEELGVTVREARPLIKVVHEYRERTVELDCWIGTAWDGEPQGREQQAFAWVTPERIEDYPILAADGPILTALRLPSHYVFTPPHADPDALIARLPALPRGALLRLRLPALGDDDYAACVRAMLAPARGLGLRVIVDRTPQMAVSLGADGWHATAAQLHALDARPALPWCFASAHGAAELDRARALGFDAAVLGTVRPSATHPGGAALGFDAAARLTQAANLPVYWIGGLQLDDLRDVQTQYAQGMAAIRAYWPD
ncbi:Nudix family hydrolase [Solimonas marina]|uniref:8-oxo-dGTP diphosphatase n=1 Tax=Solimonas marina TaxID=2714601 RepID=A0A970BA22_9GAMM|nr:Nudix family hydrolase [Solimonas marina]NKF22941.1 Nudix family hydrolase [Solimonas marina]